MRKKVFQTLLISVIVLAGLGKASDLNAAKNSGAQTPTPEAKSGTRSTNPLGCVGFGGACTLNGECCSGNCWENAECL